MRIFILAALLFAGCASTGSHPSAPPEECPEDDFASHSAQQACLQRVMLLEMRHQSALINSILGRVKRGRD